MMAATELERPHDLTEMGLAGRLNRVCCCPLNCIFSSNVSPKCQPRFDTNSMLISVI